MPDAEVAGPVAVPLQDDFDAVRVVDTAVQGGLVDVLVDAHHQCLSHRTFSGSGQLWVTASPGRGRCCPTSRYRTATPARSPAGSWGVRSGAVDEQDRDSLLVRAPQLPQLASGLRRVAGDDPDHPVASFNLGAAARLPGFVPRLLHGHVDERERGLLVDRLPHQEVAQPYVLNREVGEDPVIGGHLSPSRNGGAATEASLSHPPESRAVSSVGRVAGNSHPRCGRTSEVHFVDIRKDHRGCGSLQQHEPKEECGRAGDQDEQQPARPRTHRPL